MSESKTSKKRLGAAERQRMALELRKAGLGFEEIARRLGFAAASGAYKAVQAGLLKTLREPADALRSLELERLDTLLRSVWSLAVKGSLGAVDRALRVLERRARLLGLDGDRWIPTPREEIALMSREERLKLIKNCVRILQEEQDHPMPCEEETRE